MSSDGDSDAAEMAAMMGFSSFAQRRPKKKRRTEEDDSAPAGTASNLIPLGTRRSGLPLHPPPTDIPTRAPPQQAAPVPRRAPMSLPAPTTTPSASRPADHDDKPDDDSDPEPQYLDTSHAPFSRPTPSLPPTEEDAAAQQARIDAIIMAGNAAYSQPQPDIPLPPGQDSGFDGQYSSRHGFRPSLIESMNQGAGDGGYALHSRDGSGARGGRGGSSAGGRNTTWYIDYYDHAFNMNPWEKLEKQMGLDSKGSWMTWEERPARRGETAEAGK